MSQLDSNGKYKFKQREREACPFCNRLFQNVTSHKLNCYHNPKTISRAIKHHPARGAMLCRCNHPKSYHHSEINTATGFVGCTGMCHHVNCNCSEYVFDHLGPYTV